MKRAFCALVAIPLLLAACIPGTFSLGPSDGGLGGDDGSATGPDAAQGDAGPDQSSGIDGAGDSGAQEDSSDVAPLPDGYVECVSAPCNIADGGECCLTVIGSIGAGGETYSSALGSCQPFGMFNCGGYTQTGNMFDEQIPQTCGSAADCSAGASCCAPFSDAGDLMHGRSIGCQMACSPPDRILCKGSSDCPTGTNCVPETDPVLMLLFRRYCR